MTSEHYNAGQAAYHAWKTSPHFQQFARTAPVEEVMRLFLPPISQDLVQVSRPLPKDRQEWLQGFNDAKDQDA